MSQNLVELSENLIELSENLIELSDRLRGAWKQKAVEAKVSNEPKYEKERKKSKRARESPESVEKEGKRRREKEREKKKREAKAREIHRKWTRMEDVFIVKMKNALVPVKRVFSMNTYS